MAKKKKEIDIVNIGIYKIQIKGGYCYLDRLTSEASVAQCKLVKRAIRRRWVGHLSDDQVSKNMERKKKKVCAVGIDYPFLVGDLPDL